MQSSAEQCRARGIAALWARKKVRKHGIQGLTPLIPASCPKSSGSAGAIVMKCSQVSEAPSFYAESRVLGFGFQLRRTSRRLSQLCFMSFIVLLLSHNFATISESGYRGLPEEMHNKTLNFLNSGRYLSHFVRPADDSCCFDSCRSTNLGGPSIIEP